MISDNIDTLTRVMLLMWLNINDSFMHDCNRKIQSCIDGWLSANSCAASTVKNSYHFICSKKTFQQLNYYLIGKFSLCIATNLGFSFWSSQNKIGQKKILSAKKKKQILSILRKTILLCSFCVARTIRMIFEYL